MLRPGILWSTVTHVMLFLLFSVMFRRATMIALAYALFIETLIGNMPGIAKRWAISFYTRCLIFDAVQHSASTHLAQAVLNYSSLFPVRRPKQKLLFTPKR